MTPLNFTIGSMVDSVVIGGGRAVLPAGFLQCRGVISAIESERITDTYLAVPHLYQLLEHPDIDRADLSSLRRVIYSGSPAAPHRIATAAELLPGRLYQLYGSTECGGISSLTPADHRPRTAGYGGRPIPGVAVRVVDPDTGHDLPPAIEGGTGGPVGRSGSGPDHHEQVPRRTRRAARDGWLRTGDLGYLDDHGYLTLTGRRAGVIKTGGHKIYPAAVEAVLASHPAIGHAVVYGVTDGDRREHIHAAIVLRPDAECEREALSTTWWRAG